MTSSSALIGAPRTEVALDLVVERRRALAEGVVELTLRAAAGRSLPRWTPGAHIDVVLDGAESGPDGAVPVRQYSLTGSPDAHDAWRVAVLLEPSGRGGSRYVHEHVHPGRQLRVLGPRNRFPLDEAPAAILIAGGIGITPLLPMARRLAERGAHWRLVYGGRNRRSMAYLDELAEFGDRVEIVAQDESGLPDLDALLGRPREDTLVYCCGPAGLMDAVEQRCRVWPGGALRVERFSPARAADDAVSDQTRSDQTRSDDVPFEVRLARSGLRVTVPPGRSVLETVRAAGVEVLSSCTEGTCGTCETRVLEGVPDHRDDVLDEQEREEGASMMICVSRSRTPRLVLDL